MDSLNRALFLAINASPNVSEGELALAVFLAKYLILLLPIGLATLWLAGGRDREGAVHGLLGVGLVLLVNGVIGLAWFEPRPFVVGLGTNLLPHAPTSAFPSNHGAIMFTSAFVLMGAVARTPRLLGKLLLICALPVCWARVYLGVHWPVDMFGALAVSIVVALIMRTASARETSRIVSAILESVYRRLMAWPIARGWLRR
ncbi:MULTISPECIES: phosphatase PAP2 family protein [Pandoraea]|uniref:phosphatase PAP2 family protein n=1 Tax=Pandoraea TaxID=93217 RepID=UPI001F5DF122|nr:MULTISPECIES: phosphatase PAP2 family protein [Pandoraea]MCI3204532.1 undecaprenyl-diphosphatase [Pandoraea sp. LA3]MDN4582560.1 undecaprenyl-diphosphatase [Pandoraea capi]